MSVKLKYLGRNLKHERTVWMKAVDLHLISQRLSLYELPGSAASMAERWSTDVPFFILQSHLMPKHVLVLEL